MDNGSRTLVAIGAMVSVAAMACFKVIEAKEAMGFIGLVWATYTAIKTTMVDKNPPA
jgi:hypothetical protein